MSGSAVMFGRAILSFQDANIFSIQGRGLINSHGSYGQSPKYLMSGPFSSFPPFLLLGKIPFETISKIQLVFRHWASVTEHDGLNQ